MVRRLPRFRRAKLSHRSPIALQPRDLELLRVAHNYRLITTPQYLTLFREESQDGIYRRLQKLFHHGHLDRIGHNPNAPLVYALGRRGADVLEVAHRKEVGDRYVAHQLMIGNFRIALTFAARERGIEFAWRLVPNDAPVRPDGFFSLRFPALPEGRNRAYFFLEADRSTMSRERFVEKLHAYATWQASGGHTVALGIRAFRVLTVTKSEERSASLIEATAGSSFTALSVFWFGFGGLFAAPSHARVLEPMWQSADAPGIPKSIVPGSTS